MVCLSPTISKLLGAKAYLLSHLIRAKNVVNRIRVLIDELDRFYCNLPCFIRVICIGTEFISVSSAIAIADGVTMAAHLPCRSSDQLKLWLPSGINATISLP